MITINSQLDMTPGAIPVVIHRSQYDSDFSIVFTLFARMGNFTIASGTTAKVRGTKKSGTGYSADATIDVSAKTVTVTGDQQMTVASGQNIFEIVLMSGTKELCSANFILDVERAALDMDTITDDTVARELDNLEQFVEEAESSATRAEQAAASFATDTTLTVSGKPADAKAVGDAIANEDKKALAAFATDIASGFIASFLDGADDIPMKGVLVHVDPVQDLHGYDNPWPAGGGKNLLPLSVETIKSANTSGPWNGNTYSIAGIQFTILTDTDGNVIGIQGNGTTTDRVDFSLYAGMLPSGDFYLNGYVYTGSGGLYFTQTGSRIYDYGTSASGVAVTVDATQGVSYVRIGINGGVTVNNLVFKPMLRLASDTDATFSPYSNICPITGWTGAKVTRTGKNLLNLVKSEMISIGWNRLFPVVIKAGTYILSCQNQFGGESKHGAQVLFSDADNNVVIYLHGAYTFGDTSFVSPPVTITADNAAKIRYIRFALNESNVSYEKIVSGNIQLELGSTATDYEPYSGSTYDITFPTEAGTVYGGTLDVTKGELVVDRACVTITGNESASYVWDSYTFKPNPLIVSSNSDVFVQVCSHTSDCITGSQMFNSQSNANYPLAVCGSVGNNMRFRHRSACASLAEYQSYFQAQVTAGTPVQVFYTLATPLTYTLTPQEISSLLGANNLWADTGDSEVEYRADTKLYVDNKIAELQALVLENNGGN